MSSNLVEIVKDYGTTALQVFKRHVLFDKSLLKWVGFFGSVYLTSRMFFYKFYYPNVVNYFMPPIPVSSALFIENKNSKGNSQNNKRRNSISNKIPAHLSRRESVISIYDKSLLNRDYRWLNSTKSACRLVALVNAIITTYSGFKTMNKLNITDEFLQQGAIRANSELTLNIINTTVGYTIVDFIYLLTTPEQGDSLAYFVHHSIVILGGLTLKHTGYGGDGWTFCYAYTDLATIILHTSWFLRNAISNYDSLLKLISKKSIKNELPNIDENKMLLSDSKIVLNKYAQIILASFAMAFLYVRVYKMTKVLPLYTYNTVMCNVENWTQFTRYFFATGHVGILGVGYLWSAKVIIQLVRAITGGDSQTGDEEKGDNDEN